MRLNEVTGAHRRLLRDLAARISNRLESEFAELPGEDGPNVGLRLHERGQTVVMEIPAALLVQAGEDATARETIRVRIKARRDRMLFRPPPSPLPKHIASAPSPGGFRSGPGFNRGRR